LSISGGADARPAAAKKKRPRTKTKGGKANNSGGQKKVKESGNESDLSADSSESGDSAESRNFDGGDVGSSDDEAAPAAASGSGRSAADPISLLGPFEKAEIPPLPKVPDGSADEDIKSVLPPFDASNHSGSRVNMTAGVAGTPLIKTALQYFMLFFTSVILKTFLDATNAWGAYTEPSNRWNDVTMEEFKTFLGLLMHFGIVKYPQNTYAWRTDKYGSEWVRSMMLESRFTQILRCWHWTDTSKLSEKERAEKNKVNSFWTVQGFLDQLSDNFLHWYDPYQQVNVDEGCFGFKGRHRARCYNPAKPWKWHLKAFCLNCPITGYLFRFFMYQGKDEVRPEGFTATEYPVWRLLDHIKFKFKNIICATDNWYTSITLALKLLPQGIFLFGTSKSNKAGIPKEEVFTKTGAGKKERGVMSCSKAQVMLDGASYWIYFTSWMDNKPVHFISTFFTKFSQVSRVVKDAGRYVGKAFINIPTIAMLYNKCMGGTDAFDQFMSYYRTTITAKRWQVRVFTHFLMAAVVNAHILYKLGGGEEMKIGGLNRGDKGFTLLDFMGMLVDQLCTPGVVGGKSKKAKKQAEIEARFIGRHSPCVLHGERVAVAGGGESNTNPRRKCRVCSVLTRTFCRDCPGYREGDCAPLCIATSLDHEDSCFDIWHNPSSYEKGGVLAKIA